jgi:hypothetical protein
LVPFFNAPPLPNINLNVVQSLTHGIHACCRIFGAASSDNELAQVEEPQSRHTLVVVPGSFRVDENGAGGMSEGIYERNGRYMNVLTPARQLNAAP